MTAPRFWPDRCCLKANNLKDTPARAEALAAELKETAKQLEILKAQMAAAKIDGLFENAADIDGVRIVSAYLTARCRYPARHGR